MSKNSNFKYKSVTSKLKDNHNISDKMLVAISNIPIEDVIASRASRTRSLNQLNCKLAVVSKRSTTG